jgi:hypothetical protein
VDVPRLDYSPALNDSDQHDDDRDHKKQMNKATAHVRNEAEQPENDEKSSNRPKHVAPPIGPGSRQKDGPYDETEAIVVPQRICFVYKKLAELNPRHLHQNERGSIKGKGIPVGVPRPEM